MKIASIEHLVEMYNEGLSFDDVLMVPQYSNILSRNNISLYEPLPIPLKLPIISANMDTITEDEMAIAMAKAGGIGCIHRFMSAEKLNFILDRCLENRTVPFASIGVSKEDELFELLAKRGWPAICIDVAHGHHHLVVEKIKEVRRRIPNSTIMAGNIATTAGADLLARAGADLIKVGIGNGSNCTTREVTGHGVPQISALCEVAKVQEKLLDSGIKFRIVADGGLRKSADIAKAYACGATYVMLGSMLAGAPETPGVIIEKDGQPYKEYRGMASFRAQEAIGKNRTPEGVSRLVKLGSSVTERLAEIKGGIQSALSYSGATNLDEFRAYAVFVKISHAAHIEGTPHGLVPQPPTK